jgi:hypothetical protein
MRAKPFRLLRRLAGLGTVLGMIGAASAVAADASAFTTTFNGLGSFVVRPSHIVLDEADGGSFDLRWTRWDANGAVAHGTSQQDHGVYKVMLALSDPEYGTFQRLAITFYESATSTVDRLELATYLNAQHFHEWASRSWVDDSSASGLYAYIPDFDHACQGIGGASVGGRHGVAAGTACSIATADVHAGGIKCESSPVHAYVIQRAFDGFAVTEQPVGMLFERGSTYFTFDLQCSY